MFVNKLSEVEAPDKGLSRRPLSAVIGYIPASSPAAVYPNAAQLDRQAVAELLFVKSSSQGKTRWLVLSLKISEISRDLRDRIDHSP